MLDCVFDCRTSKCHVLTLFLSFTGFCTPGIIVSIYSLYANHASVSEIEEHLDGNLCRCTGYRPIWDAARALCDDAEDLVRGPCGTPCRECPERDECEQDCNTQDKAKEATEKDVVVCSSSKDKVAMKKEFIGDYEDWQKQPLEMFPQALDDVNSKENQELTKPMMIVDSTDFQGAGTWFKPTTLTDLLLLLKDFGGENGGGYKIVVGNTEVGIGKNHNDRVEWKLVLDAGHKNSRSQISFRNQVQACRLPTSHLPLRQHLRTVSAFGVGRQTSHGGMYASQYHST